jgi:acyl carrier protein
VTAGGLEAVVRELLETALGAPPQPADNPARAHTDRWDSLVHLEIVFLLEERFDLRFSEEEIASLDSLDGIVSVLREKHAV